MAYAYAPREQKSGVEIQIEKMVQVDDERPAWADEILHELRDIKALLSQNQPKRVNNKEYFKFVNMLRERIRIDIANSLVNRLLF